MTKICWRFACTRAGRCLRRRRAGRSEHRPARPRQGARRFQGWKPRHLHRCRCAESAMKAAIATALRNSLRGVDKTANIKRTPFSCAETSRTPVECDDHNNAKTGPDMTSRHRSRVASAPVRALLCDAEFQGGCAGRAISRSAAGWIFMAFQGPGRSITTTMQDRSRPRLICALRRHRLCRDNAAFDLPAAARVTLAPRYRGTAARRQCADPGIAVVLASSTVSC